MNVSKSVVQIDKNYIMVGLYNAKFHIEGIIKKIMDGTAKKYSMNTGHMSFCQMDKLSYAFHYYCFECMISHGAETNGWYDMEWKENDRECILDTLFYDEYMFLLNENLIEFDDVDLMTDEDIHNNYINYLNVKENTFLSELYSAKTKDELKVIYRNLIKQYHPDYNGDLAIAQQITVAYSQRKKQLK